MDGGKRVSVVTGANKGIGFAIVRGLCKTFDGDVYLTARNEELGLKAVEDLKKEGCNAKFHQLDIRKPDMIARLKIFLEETYGGLDVLVNNAGIAYLPESTLSFGEQAEESVRTNFTGTLDVCEGLFPILRSNARVVNISTLMSLHAVNTFKPDLQKTLMNIAHMSMEDIKAIMKQFVDSAKMGTYKDLGWANGFLGAYTISKIGTTIMSFIQQRELLKDSRSDIVVNACCPGYVDTDMSGHKGTKTIDEGADTPLYLALLPPNTENPKGEFVSDRKITKWEISQP